MKVAYIGADIASYDTLYEKCERSELPVNHGVLALHWIIAGSVNVITGVIIAIVGAGQPFYRGPIIRNALSFF